MQQQQDIVLIPCHMCLWRYDPPAELYKYYKTFYRIFTESLALRCGIDQISNRSRAKLLNLDMFAYSVMAIGVTLDVFIEHYMITVTITNYIFRNMKFTCFLTINFVTIRSFYLIVCQFLFQTPKSNTYL